MKLENQVSSLELCKRLKELGVKQESLFYWTKHAPDEDLQLNMYESERRAIEWSCSAFTVAELGEMLPWEVLIIENGEYLIHLSDKMGSSEWYCELLASLGSGENLHNHREIANTEADARAKMLIYLLENKLL